MHITRISLENFRNYGTAQVEPSRSRNILIGDNAQGKSNFLEAIEYASTGSSDRILREAELIRHGERSMRVNVSYLSEGMDEQISIDLKTRGEVKMSMEGEAGATPTEREIKINGVKQSSIRSLKRRLITVSFKSLDLNLLRGGPKYRRDWIDGVLSTLKPGHVSRLAQYQKVVTQRNKLLRTISERGRVTVSDQDQLKVWDVQLARLAAEIIKERLELMRNILPEAERYHHKLSDSKERLSAEYAFKMKDQPSLEGSFTDGGEEEGDKIPPLSMTSLLNEDTAKIASLIVSHLKELRGEEIARKQTLIGPHRDDIRFYLNDASAVSFASQGQQRSLVLSLKLAELKAVSAAINEEPVLLLDDVLAELDLTRQGYLMSLAGANMQTFVTTTHVSGFRDEWLAGAKFLNVSEGQCAELKEPLPL
ncbi:MAG TPA: DNA replication/repair protein RecF [Candidatus Obscuribacterales bacterium]